MYATEKICVKLRMRKEIRRFWQQIGQRDSIIKIIKKKQFIFYGNAQKMEDVGKNLKKTL